MILLKFSTEIKGNSKVKDHEGWIEFNDMQISSGRHIHVTNSERETGQPFVSELVLSKDGDIASPNLFIQSLTGKSLGEATVHFIQTAGEDNTNQIFMELKISEPIISYYSAKSSGGRPVENISINFVKAEYAYTEYSGKDKTPEVRKKWDLLKHAPA
ncbi:type VI secretion system tube protein Hcp [Cedecea sp.]|uniref:type VI secretion system tube protein Hcp n=1 Tax=Cedecea sp. TaxID=1970739 RepID=UPI002F419D12